MIFRAFSRFLPLLLLFVMAGAAASQPLPDRFPIVGSAVDAEGKPLSGAVITLRRQDDAGSYSFWGAETSSDASGAFRFGLAEVGRYYLSAEIEGFAPISNQNLVWKTGDAPLQLRFERLVTLKLQLFVPPTSDSASKDVPLALPLANSAVWVRLRGDGNAGQSTRRAFTDNLGQLTLEKLLPARYSLYIATQRGFATQNGVTLHDEISQKIQLQAGGKLIVTVSQTGQLQPFLGGAILSLAPIDVEESKRLLGESADPNENIGLLAASGDFSALASRDGDGKIEILNLPPGNYLARVRLPFYTVSPGQPVTIRAREAATAGFEVRTGEKDMAALTLTLRSKNRAASGEFSVRMLPVNAQGQLATDESPDTVAFLPGGNPARRVRADSSGKITLFPLKVGRYRFFVAPRLPGNNAEDASTQNSPVSASIDVDVPLGGGAATLELPDVAPNLQ